jgi:hypothetical protein
MSAQAKQDDLISRIKVHLEKGAQAEEKAEQHYTSAGEHLKTLKDTCKDQAAFLALVKEQIGLGKTRTFELLRIADGTKTVEQTRADRAKRDTKANEKVKAKLSAVGGQTEQAAGSGNGTDAEQSAQHRKEAFAALEQTEQEQSTALAKTALAEPDDEPEEQPTAVAVAPEPAGDDNEPFEPVAVLISALRVVLHHARKPMPVPTVFEGKLTGAELAEIGNYITALHEIVIAEPEQAEPIITENDPGPMPECLLREPAATTDDEPDDDEPDDDEPDDDEPDDDEPPTKPRRRKKGELTKEPLGDAIGNAFSQLEELGTECREVVDNTADSPGLSGTQRILTLDETANVLEGLSPPDIPNELANIEVEYDDTLPRRAGRGVRATSAVGIIETVVQVLHAIDENDPRHGEASGLADELENIAGEVEGCDFPGMFG